MPADYSASSRVPRNSLETIGSGNDLGGGACNEVAPDLLESVSLVAWHKATNCMDVTNASVSAASDDPISLVFTLLR